MWKVGEGFPSRVRPKTLKWVVVYFTSMDSTTTGRSCVYTVTEWVSCPVSVAWLSSVAAHWSKYHCHRQAPSRYDLRCSKATNKLTNHLLEDPYIYTSYMFFFWKFSFLQTCLLVIRPCNNLYSVISKLTRVIKVYHSTEEVSLFTLSLTFCLRMLLTKHL